MKVVRPLTISLAFLAITYALTLPSSPLEGDSAEIVSRAWNLGVMHPPGYPLATLYFWLAHFIPILNPFQAAAALNALLALGSLALLFFNLPVTGWLAAGFTLAIGTSRIFWTYAVTPEVFAGLAFFTAAFVAVHENPQRYSKPWWTLLLAASVLHHHTIVFALPLLMWAAWQNRFDKRAHIWAISWGILSLSGYGVLLLFARGQLSSWGNLHNLSDVLHHFLREDYGTFTLMRSGSSNHLLKWSLTFQEIITACAAALIIPLLRILEGKKDFPLTAARYFSCAFFYIIVFLGLSNINPEGPGSVVLERFLLFPIILIYAGCTHLIPRRGSSTYKLAIGLLFAQIFINVMTVAPALLNGSREVAGRWCRDLMESLPLDASLSLTSDTAYFSATYWQEVEGIRPDLVLFPFNITLTKFNQYKKKYPERMVDSPHGFNILDKVEVERRPFFFSGTSQHIPASHIERFGLEFHDLAVRVTSKPETLLFACNPAGPRYRGPDAPLSSVTSMGEFSLDYSLCEHLAGVDALNRGDQAYALTMFKQAIEKNPWNIYAQERICHLFAETNSAERSACQAKLENLIAVTHPYYLGFKFLLPSTKTR